METTYLHLNGVVYTDEEDEDNCSQRYEALDYIGGCVHLEENI